MLKAGRLDEDQNLNSFPSNSNNKPIPTQIAKQKEPKCEPFKESNYDSANELPSMQTTRPNEMKREELREEEPSKYESLKAPKNAFSKRMSRDHSYEERVEERDSRARDEYQGPECERAVENEAEREDFKGADECADASFLTTNKELFGVSAQVQLDAPSLHSLYNAGTCPVMPMYPYGVMPHGSVQQPYIDGMPSGFMNPMMSYPMQGPYSIAGNFATQSVQPQGMMFGRCEEKVPCAKEVQDNSKVVNDLNEEIKRLQTELKEARLTIEAQKVQSSSSANAESRLKELEEKLRRKDMDSRITEDMLRSELDVLKRRNEVLLRSKQ